MPRSRVIRIDGQALRLEDVEAIANGAGCTLSAGARRAVKASRRLVDSVVADNHTVYGVNTGFGHLADVRIPQERLDELQRNLVRSHSAGVGEPLSPRFVRAILALRANCLARGHSGLRIETLERLIEMLNHQLLPVVPRQGSVGASGDLAPLAHIALAMIGEGQVELAGRRMSAARAWRKLEMKPLNLGAKEGLALINGTQVMTAIGLLAFLTAERLTLVADICGAMTLEALKGSHKAFDARIHDARPHPGQRTSAKNLRRLLGASAIARSHRECGRVQDHYSLRCMAQVHGAVRDGLDYIRPVLEIEANASTDNPMIFAEQNDWVSGGNFHGHPVSVALDHLATSSCSLGTISERRLERLVNPDHSGLPAFLAHRPGLDSGFMIAQVTAAALVSENKVLAHPASVDSIPTSANKEDHVSMGTHAARKADRIVDHVVTVLAIELLCATQALDMLAPLTSTRAVEAARTAVRKKVPRLRKDRVLASDINTARGLILDGTLVDAVTRRVGRLA